MTLAGKLMALFPAALMAGVVASLWWFAASPSIWPLLALIAVLYLVPPLAFRLHQRIVPLREGAFDIGAPVYEPWWGAYMCQCLYGAVPQLEGLIRLIPGAYSAWLRLWGSRIGKGVHWTPAVEVTDRSLLDVGDGVIFGHKVGCYAHLIRPRAGSARLLVRRIRIGDSAFVGAGSRLGPGVTVPDGSLVPMATDLHVGQTFRPEPAQPDLKEAA